MPMYGGNQGVGGADTQVQFNDGGVLSGDAGLTFNKTMGAMSVGGATVTADAPVQSLSQTWNNAAVAFTGWKLNITNTASGADSLLASIQSEGAMKFAVGKGGEWQSNSGQNRIHFPFNGTWAFSGPGAYNTALVYFNGASLSTRSGGIYGWSNSATNAATTVDTALGRSGAGVVEVNDGTAGQYRDIKVRTLFTQGGFIYPPQYTNATEPSFQNGAFFFNTDLDKLRVGGAAAWETVTSAA